MKTLSTCRFLRHVPVVYVDYPGPASLTQIYGTFNRAMLRLIPSLRTYAEPLTAAMVEFYTMSQVKAPATHEQHLMPGASTNILILQNTNDVLFTSFIFFCLTPPGTLHSGHPASLHLLSQRDDPLGEGDL